MSLALQVSYDHRRGFDPGVTQNELHGRYEADNMEFQRDLRALLAKWQLVIFEVDNE